jgi:hypothetical protein
MAAFAPDYLSLAQGLLVSSTPLGARLQRMHNSLPLKPLPPDRTPARDSRL